MAKIDVRPYVIAQITITLSEDEAAALEALAGYGVDSFLKVFYEKLGKAYLAPHEVGLRSLFSSISSSELGIKRFLDSAKQARELFNSAVKLPKNTAQ